MAKSPTGPMSTVRNTRTRGLVCLTPPGQRVAEKAHSYSMVSELASWLHRNDWPVEIVAGNAGTGDPDGPIESILPGLATPSGLGTSPEVIGMGYRLRRLSPT